MYVCRVPSLKCSPLVIRGKSSIGMEINESMGNFILIASKIPLSKPHNKDQRVDFHPLSVHLHATHLFMYPKCTGIAFASVTVIIMLTA